MSRETETYVLVAGAAGFIGSHLVEYLRRMPNHTVIPIDLDVLDLATPNASQALPSGIDYCYHFAGTMPTWKFYELPHQLLSNDLRVTLNLAEWASQGNCRKIIYSSSNEVYLQPDVDEDVELLLGPVLQPRTSYQLSKIASEAILYNWSKKAGFEVTSFRLSNTYGPRMHEDQVVYRFLQQARKRPNPFLIGGFDSSRQFVHVSDVVRILVELKDLKTPIVNVPGEEVCLLDLAKMICRIAGYAPEFVEIARQPGSPIVKRLRSKHWLPPLQVSLEEGLRSLYESLHLTA